jgi:hypothetical protein
MKKRKRKDDRHKYGPLGKRQPAPETPLYVRCPHCNGPEVLGGYDDAGNCSLCQDGYIETGFTQDRFDRLIGKADKLLVALDEALRELSPSIRLSVLRANGYTETDVDDAKSRL